MIKQLSRGSKGPDVREVQKALNARIKAGLDPDGDFGSLTEQAIVAFQKRYYLQVDGIVGSQTRHALFPLVGLTLHAAGGFTRGDYRPMAGRTVAMHRFANRPLLAMAGGAIVADDVPPSDPNPIAEQLLKLLPLLKDPSSGPLDGFPLPAQPLRLPIPPILTAPLLSIPGMQLDSQQVQPGVQFNTRPFWQSRDGSANPSGSAVLAIQSVLALDKDKPGHFEFAEGFQLGAPFTAQTSDGKDWTLQWFAQATWVDPFWKRGQWHLVQPFAQVSAQMDLKSGTPTLGAGLFPVNTTFEVIEDSLSLFGQAGVVTAWDVVGKRVEVGSQAGVGVNITLGGK